MHLVGLSRADHSHLKLDQERSVALSAGLRAVPLMLSEFVAAAVYYPIVLTKDAVTGRFAAVALTGFEEGQNLFWTGDGWDADYVPLHVRRQPFYAGSEETDGGPSPVLLIDADSAAWTQQGELLFDAQGRETPVFREKIAIVRKILEDAPATQGFIGQLSDLRLISELRVVIDGDDAEHVEVHGLYGINEEVFEALTDDKLLQLWHTRDLDCLYAMTVSLGCLGALIRRRERAQEQSRRWLTSSGT